ncbi:unnamed protein product [Caretta caretta]
MNQTLETESEQSVEQGQGNELHPGVYLSGTVVRATIGTLTSAEPGFLSNTGGTTSGQQRVWKKRNME